MTTERCSVDSLPPKNRAETFARQLQNRLRTLNGDEVDGLEDTSWNGDQLSSSSDDIYYDLDSYPGSPVEEGTELDFTNYINVKNNGYPTTAKTNGFSNQNSSSPNGEDKLEYEELAQCSRVKPLHHCTDSNCTQFFCQEPDDEELACKQCASYQEKFLTSNNKTNYSSKHNGLPENAISLTDQLLNNKDGMNKIDEQNCKNAKIQRNSDVVKNLCNGINRIDINKEESKPDHIYKDFNLINDQHKDWVNTSNNEYSNTSDSSERTNDDNWNLTLKENKNHRPDMTSITLNINAETTTENAGLLLSNIENNTNYSNNCNDILRTNECNACLDYKNDKAFAKEASLSLKEDYTEEDLTKLVDAVFLQSQENDLDESTCQEVTSRGNAVPVISYHKCSGTEEDEETIESKRSKFRRCSSLKTGKTPPGTPGRKKIVRFADVLGLDLADVRTFLDEVPRVPKSAFIDLKNVELSSSPPTTAFHSFMGQDATQVVIPKSERTIVPLFQQPSSRPEFMDRVRNRFVCLENAIITDPSLSVITGVVRVKNIDFHKSVHVRYSIDNWKSFADLQAKYVPNSCDGFSDKFTFILYAHMLNVGQRLEFAVRYHANGLVFWDNNFGANYTFQCVPDGPSKVLPAPSYVPASPIETWASFY